MIKQPVRREVSNPAAQPKVFAPRNTATPKKPCNFCKEVREKVRGVIEHVIGKGKGSK